jgi:hypothetical protein
MTALILSSYIEKQTRDERQRVNAQIPNLITRPQSWPSAAFTLAHSSHGMSIGSYERLAGITDRTNFWLVSANSLWNDRKRRFGSGRAYRGFDIALDSGGFVAMKRYGRYRWQVPDYVRLARDMRPTWWAQMDFCCEPEIAGDSATVWARIGKTVQHLHECDTPEPEIAGFLGRGPTFAEIGIISSPGTAMVRAAMFCTPCYSKRIATKTI